MKRFLLCITMLCLSAVALNAQTITWTGAGDGTNWSDPNNWDLLVIPTTANDVIIPDGSTLAINSHAVMKSLTVQGNSVLTINNAFTLGNPSAFDENVVVNWSFGALFGNLTNRGTININQYEPTFFPPSIYGTLKNEGIINLNDGGLAVVGGGILSNEAAGLINFQADDTFISPFIDGIGTINNYGIIKKEIGSGVSYLNVITNNMGKIEVSTGLIEFYSYSSFSAELNNKIEGVINGTATIGIHELTNFTNYGSFEPGASPGTLTFIGDFTSTTTSKLDIELNGLTQGSAYDLLVIDGNAIFNGVVNVTMGFEGSLNDEFIVATTTGAITECNLASVTTAEYNGNVYDFTVACRNNNEVVLTVVNITLDIESDEITQENIQLFPNPVSNNLTLRNNSNQDLKSATLIDLNGRVVKEIDLKGILKEKVISLSSYDTGIYLIKVISNTNNFIIKKIVKL